MSPQSRRRKNRSAAARPSRPHNLAQVATPRSPPVSPLSYLPPLVGVGAGFDYAVLQVHPQRDRWRMAVGVLMAVSAYAFITPIIAALVLQAWFLISKPGVEFAQYQRSAMAGELPVGLLATNLAISSFIVICVVLARTVGLIKPGYLASVLGRTRWPLLLASAAIALAVFTTVQGIGIAASSTALQPQAALVWFVVVIALTTPLQAAAEEVFFRGYLLQSVGSLAGRWWAGVVVSSLLFALAHGVQSPALFANRFAFGLLAGLLVWRTGGLEAAIGIHVVNNVLAFVLAGLTATIAEARAIQTIGWDKAALDIAVYAVIAALCGAFVAWRRAARVTRADSIERVTR